MIIDFCYWIFTYIRVKTKYKNMSYLSRFFGTNVKTTEVPACDHDWQIEHPTIQIGEHFKQWDGPVRDVCRKCGAMRPHPECNHSWKRCEDDGKGWIVNGVKVVRVRICKKCGCNQYKTPKNNILWKIFRY